MNHIHSYSWCCGKWQGAWCHGESNERNACCLTCFEKKMSNTVDFSKMFLAGNCHCLAAPVTAFSRFSGVCLMILAAKWWIASLFKMLHLAFYGVRAFERSMYSTLVPEQQLWKQRCFPILAVLCQQMRCSVLDDKHVKRWIIFIHTHDAVESGKAHDVMVKGMKEMLAVWLAFRKTCQIQ